MAEPAPPGPGTTSGLGLVDVRRLWPDLLDAVKTKRRYTWILLSQNAQVVGVDDKTLTIGLVNAGARNSFMSGGSDEILRQAAIDVIGQDWRVEAVVDPSAQPGTEPTIESSVRSQPSQAARPADASGSGGGQDSAPAGPATAPGPAIAPGPAKERPSTGAGSEPTPPQQSAEQRRAADPAAIASAREAILQTRPQGSPRQEPESTVSDDDVDPDDPDADDDLGGAQLLERELGARVIEEIKHD